MLPPEAPLPPPRPPRPPPRRDSRGRGIGKRKRCFFRAARRIGKIIDLCFPIPSREWKNKKLDVGATPNRGSTSKPLDPPALPLLLPLFPLAFFRELLFSSLFFTRFFLVNGIAKKKKSIENRHQKLYLPLISTLSFVSPSFEPAYSLSLSLYLSPLNSSLYLKGAIAYFL